MTNVPANELKPGFYGYFLPGWTKPTRVELYISEGYLDGELLVRFVEGYYGARMRDLPHGAIFLVASDADTPMRQGYLKVAQNPPV